MKVRYGKPIKAKSMLSNSFSREVSSSGSYALVYKNWGVGADVEFRAFTEADYSHKFFCYTEFELATNNFTHTGFAAQGTSESTYKPNNYSLCSINKPTANSVSLYVYGTLQNPITVKTRFMIDLTEIGLDNLTAEEFYDRYKGKFGLLATGEEITLDRKVGNIQDIKSAFDGYTEVEYLESTSTQYIDTKYIPNQNTKIIFDTKMSQIPGQGVYPRQGRHGEGQRLSIYLTPSITEFAMGDYKQLSINAWNQRHTYELDVPNLCAKLDGEVVATFEPLSWTNQQSLYLFARHVNTSPYYDGNGNITNYNIKIYESNILVHNFIPCIRNNDNTPGMYDLVDGIFYTNQGTGTFIAGPVKSLPSEYQQVEYIEGTGTQYMGEWTLNKTYTGNLTVGYKFTVTEHTDAMYFSTITASGLSAHQAYSLGYTGASSDLYVRWNQLQNSVTRVDYTIPEICEVSRTNAINNVTLANVSLFCHSTSYRPWKGRIYKYWLKIDDNYIFDFIPCYRKSDNEIGLYDRVKKAFYANRGTGTFLKGPNVATVISCKIAGGSSDVYYGYNQRILPGDNTTNNGNAYSYDRSTNTFTLTANSSTTTYYFGLSCTNLSAMRSHKALCIANITEISLAGIFYDISFSWALSNITDNHNVTAAGDWVYAIGTWRATATANYLNITTNSSNPFAQGDYFKVKDVQIIDLTDWFGPGNEPATVEEFREKFAREYYGFCPTPIKLTRYQIEASPSYGYNQLIKNGNFVDTSCWSPTYGAITANDNICTYTITQVGAVGSNQNRINYAQSWQTNISMQHKFLFASEIYCKYAQNLSFIVHDRSNGYREVLSSSKKGVANAWNEFSAIMTAKYDCLASNADMRIGFSSTSDSAVGDKYYAKNFILVDLTDWYGEGNEPTTVEEFKQTFPNKYYPYSQKRLLNKYMINKLVD